jgi:hypothetical protein
MVGSQEGIGVLKLECPQSHPAVMYDPGAAVGPRRFWPDEDDQPRFTTHCRFCDKRVGDATATLQGELAALVADVSRVSATATLPYA